MLAPYEPISVIAVGAHGSVYRARDRRTGTDVVLKQRTTASGGMGIPSDVLREVALLKGFDEPNVVRLLDIQCTPSEFFMVFEHVEQDLKQYIRSLNRNGELLSLEEVKHLSRQLVKGAHICHSRHIMHRDLNPWNILVVDGTLKICDFGCARPFSFDKAPLTYDVTTVWYRAPELLLGQELYGPEIDMWSVGCIVVEIASGCVSFPGDSAIGTLFKIFNVMGTPSEETWPGISEMPFYKEAFPCWRNSFPDILEWRPDLGPSGLSLLEDLLRVYPQGRSSARDALEHNFFASESENQTVDC
eukprot:TRINITY_DN14131_c0_g1_i3.p1 TRINITY_DN14131_c0_g1~~TRINITY_DN14131_c0_g1_i3.p1  ORF type:complete len:302 (-),score=18.04 TRINITY_DN14131_c0_g1_i3:164-1069(-)